LEATGSKACSGILVLLAPTVEKEFQRIAFPDPGAAQQVVQAMFKGYESIDDFSSDLISKTMCKEITLFFLRLIILVGTCVISIRPNKALTGILGTIGSSFSEQFDTFQGIVKIKMDGIAKPVPLAAEAERKPDERAEKKEKIFDTLIRHPNDLVLRQAIKVILEKDLKQTVKRKAGDYYIVVGPDGKEYVIDIFNLFVYPTLFAASKIASAFSGLSGIEKFSKEFRSFLTNLPSSKS
jgi:hypothetical protein